MKHLSSKDYVIINASTQAPLTYFHSGDIILYASKEEAQDDVREWDEIIIPCTYLSQQYIGQLIDQINRD